MCYLRMVLFSLLPAAKSCTDDGGYQPPRHMPAMVINAQCRWLWCSLNARGDSTQDLHPRTPPWPRGHGPCHCHWDPLSAAALNHNFIWDGTDLARALARSRSTCPHSTTMWLWRHYTWLPVHAIAPPLQVLRALPYSSLSCILCTQPGHSRASSSQLPNLSATSLLCQHA